MSTKFWMPKAPEQQLEDGECDYCHGVDSAICQWCGGSGKYIREFRDGDFSVTASNAMRLLRIVGIEPNEIQAGTITLAEILDIRTRIAEFWGMRRHCDLPQRTLLDVRRRECSPQHARRAPRRRAATPVGRLVRVT